MERLTTVKHAALMCVCRKDDNAVMRLARRPVVNALVVLGFAGALAWPATGSATQSVGTAAQIAWVRSAASRFVTAELDGDGESACAVLTKPQRGEVGGRTCAQRWDARSAKLRHTPGARAALHKDLVEVAHAPVVVHGDVATIDVGTPLMSGSDKLLWTENCWMVEG